MAFDTGISSAVAQYVYTQSNGAVTEPVNGSYIQAYCEFLGINEPLYNSWLIALCNHFGITQPLNGSWTIALANHYDITYPTGGTWWMALAFAGAEPTGPIANFTSNVTTTPENTSIDFEDTSNPNGSPITAWLWTFEGGTPGTATDQNPTITYDVPGTYDVSLQVTNANGTNTKSVPNYVTVANSQIVADFSSSTQTPTEGQTVQFTDESYGDTATAWNWTFTGGTPSSSTAQNPEIQYNTAGDYAVSLQVFDETGSNTKTVPNYISVSVAPSGFLINSWDLGTGYNILEPTGIETNKNLMLFRL